MYIVRFIELASELPEEWFMPTWGILEGNTIYPLPQAPYHLRSSGNGFSPRIIGPARRRQDVRLIAPVVPGKLVCVGRNYAAHAAELGNEVPAEPLIFLKPPTAVIGPDAPVVYPVISQRIEHEAELAVVIGRRCRHLQEDEVSDVIFGYTVANDVTARDLQQKDGQWTRGKGFDTFAPVGPWIDTDFDPSNRAVRCLVNGELRQNGNTSLMIYPIERILTHVTQFMTLEPGDLVLTGTPAGVGPVQVSDIMTVTVDGLGELSNPVISEQHQSGT